MTHPDTELLQLDGDPRLILADHIALHLFGDHLDDETPIGRAVLATTGRAITLELADAALSCPGFTYTPDPS